MKSRKALRTAKRPFDHLIFTTLRDAQTRRINHLFFLFQMGETEAPEPTRSQIHTPGSKLGGEGRELQCGHSRCQEEVGGDVRVGTGAPQCASGMQRGVGWGMMTVWGVCTLQSTFSKTGNFLTVLKRNADPMVFKAGMKRY